MLRESRERMMRAKYEITIKRSIDNGDWGKPQSMSFPASPLPSFASLYIEKTKSDKESWIFN